jgi:hypothetical protein
MRASFLRHLLPFTAPLVVALALGLGAAACSSRVTGTGPDDPGAPPTARPTPVPAPECTVHDGTTCAFLTRHTLDEPPHDQAIVWSQVSAIPAATDPTNTPKLAVYEDGTLRRNTVLRNLVFAAIPPRGLITGTVSAASLARLRADVAALNADDFKGFFAPDERPSAADSLLDVIEVGGASGCSHGINAPASSCRTAAYSRVELDLVALAAASEASWRAALAGTVSLGAEMKVAGDWPLADDGSGDGAMTLSPAQWQSVQAVGSDGLYRMPNGDFLQVDVSSSDGFGNTAVYTTRMSAVVLGDDLAALRDELVANEDRYETSIGAWLGVELGADRFPAFKHRELAVLPASGESGVTVRYLYAIEHLDLRGDGDLVIP